MNTESISVKIEYSESHMPHTQKGSHYNVISKCMDILIGEPTPLPSKQPNAIFHSNKIIIMNEGPQKHHRLNSEPTPDDCITSISLFIFTKCDEYKKINAVIAPLMRPDTCDKTYCLESIHRVYLESSRMVALQALDKLIEVSEEIFGVTSDRWIRRAKEFIIHGPETKFKENHLFPERAFNKQKSKL